MSVSVSLTLSASSGVRVETSRVCCVVCVFARVRGLAGIRLPPTRNYGFVRTVQLSRSTDP